MNISEELVAYTFWLRHGPSQFLEHISVYLPQLHNPADRALHIDRSDNFDVSHPLVILLLLLTAIELSLSGSSPYTST